MYSKQEAAKIRQQFWITFGKYMKPVLSAEGLPVNWINYKTGVKHIRFRMDATQQEAHIAIELIHPDEGERALCFAQLKALQSLFMTIAGPGWDWLPDAVNEYEMPFSRIASSISGFSIYDQDKWPELISFLKPRIIALDHFWTEVKPAFEAG